MATNRNHNRENKETEKNMHLIKSLEINTEDVVLVAIPMRENTWLEVIDACINGGTDFVLIDPVAEAASLTETIEREKVTVVATTPQLWNRIYHQLNTYSGKIKSLRVIRYNERGEPESLVPRNSAD